MANNHEHYIYHTDNKWHYWLANDIDIQGVDTIIETHEFCYNYFFAIRVFILFRRELV